MSTTVSPRTRPWPTRLAACAAARSWNSPNVIDCSPSPLQVVRNVRSLGAAASPERSVARGPLEREIDKGASLSAPGHDEEDERRMVHGRDQPDRAPRGGVPLELAQPGARQLDDC